MARKPNQTYFDFGDYHLPVIHHKENRTSVRFSITKKGLIIRSPIFSFSRNIKTKAKEWCMTMAQQKPAALGRFKIRNYTNGGTITIYNTPFVMQISESDGPKDIITWKKNQLDIKVNRVYGTAEKSRVIKGLLMHFAAKRFLLPISERVEKINNLHFNVAINKIRLKNNYTNWGSCSSKGNINLSTRLLLAPPEVIDYVIIHELAHRIELNHSKRFWSIVSDACREYKHMERWLKNNSHLCEF
jgi:predicted metal-dependent hydrolase